MRNITHEILREWFRRWYRYATEVRQNPLASAVPYRLEQLAICQDALEEVMRRKRIGQTEIEGLKAEVEAHPAPDIIHPHKISRGGIINEKMDDFRLETRTQGSLHCDIPTHPRHRLGTGVVDSNVGLKYYGESLIKPRHVGQSEQDREFRDAILADQTKCQRGDWGK